MPEDWDPGFRALAVQPFGEGALSPQSASRAMAMWVVEGERRWILTVQGSAGDHPRRTEEKLRKFVSSIGVPEIDKALAEVESPEKIAMWRDTRSRLRDFAKPQRPEGFLAIGDACMGFNPVYGQGMTAAAQEAADLRTELDAQLAEHPGDLSGLPGRFYARADQLIKFCWNSSNTLDHRIPGGEYTVDGESRRVDPSSADFSDRLAAYMSLDPDRYVRYRETNPVAAVAGVARERGGRLRGQGGLGRARRARGAALIAPCPARRRGVAWTRSTSCGPASRSRRRRPGTPATPTCG
ncbi:hypothetical protein ABZ468_43410 [Streptomyces sp. NPDC005708]|uniref:hypothetical protein n=1 Tax=unclassified Streptomyces TaxID=2593676 RepID=UPI00340F0027